MARTARSVHARKRRKVLEQAKGYRIYDSSYKRAKEQVWKSGGRLRGTQAAQEGLQGALDPTHQRRRP